MRRKEKKTSITAPKGFFRILPWILPGYSSDPPEEDLGRIWVPENTDPYITAPEGAIPMLYICVLKAGPEGVFCYYFIFFCGGDGGSPIMWGCVIDYFSRCSLF